MSAEPILPIRPIPDPVAALRESPEAGPPASLAAAIEPMQVPAANGAPPVTAPPPSERPAQPAALAEPLLVPAAKAARLCGVSEASWYRLKAAGKLPAPVRLGGRVLWRVEELRRWCAAGCPDLRTWQALESARRATASRCGQGG